MYYDDWTSSLLENLSEDENGKLVTKQVAFATLKAQRNLMAWIPGLSTLMSNSMLANFARDSLRARITWPPRTHTFLENEAENSTKQDDKAARAMRITKKILIALKDATHQAGSRLLVVSIPNLSLLQAEFDDPALRDPPARLIKHFDARRDLLNFFETHEIESLDISRELLRHSQGDRQAITKFYFETDIHFTKEINGILAEQLRDKILRN